MQQGNIKDVPAATVPLVTDLDGTLIATDLLYLAVRQLLKKNILYAPVLFFWLARGKAYMKKNIFDRVQIDTASLPFNKAVQEFLKAEHEKGRKIVLATASPLTEAKKLAVLFPVFSEVYGTENNHNLKGPAKQQRLAGLYGENGFDYIGDSSADLPVFASCRFAYLVNPSAGLEKKARQVAVVKQVWKNEQQ